MFQRIKTVSGLDDEEDLKHDYNNIDEIIQKWNCTTQHLKYAYSYYFELVKT